MKFAAELAEEFQFHTVRLRLVTCGSLASSSVNFNSTQSD